MKITGEMEKILCSLSKNRNHRGFFSHPLSFIFFFLFSIEKKESNGRFDFFFFSFGFFGFGFGFNFGGFLFPSPFCAPDEFPSLCVAFCFFLNLLSYSLSLE